MAIHHIGANIEGLLRQKDSVLKNLLGMPARQARAELEALRAKGDKYIPSENCTHFDPLKGCQCCEPENQPIEWGEIGSQDFMAKVGEYCLHAEMLDAQLWWWCVYFGQETIDSQNATSGKKAKAIAENCFKEHQKQQSCAEPLK